MHRRVVRPSDTRHPSPRAMLALTGRTQHARRQRSPAWLLVCLLAVVTALLCYQVAASMVPSALPPPAPDRVAAAQVALVHRFYTAVNTALRTGETTALDALVADDLIAHPAPVGTASGRAAFVQDLLLRRTLYPDLQVIVDDLQATTADQVTARLQTTGHETGTFLGLPLPPGMLPWPPLEQFRIAEDRIVERWMGPEAPVHLAPRFQTTLPAPLTGMAYLQVSRVTYPPTSMVPLGSDVDQRLTYLEAGTLTVPDTRWAGSNAVAWDTTLTATAAAAWDTTLAATAGMLLPADPGLRATVPEDEAAVVLEVAILGDPPDLTRPIPERTVNVEATVLATALVVGPDWPGMEVAVGHVSLVSGATLAFPPTPGSLLLAVETGELEVTAEAGRVAKEGSLPSLGDRPPSQVPGAGVVSAPPHQEPVAAGAMVVLGPHAPSLWHNPGPEAATVLVLVITPAGGAPAARLATPLLATTPDSWCAQSPGCR